MLRELPKLDEHEQLVQELIFRLEGAIQGFPDTPRKVENVTRAWAKFISLEPYHVRFNPQVEPYLTAEDKAQYAWKENLIPGEWLIDKIREQCKFFPAAAEARVMYCRVGWPPVDGVSVIELLDAPNGE
jgi:hypothetical protein